MPSLIPSAAAATRLSPFAGSNPQLLANMKIQSKDELTGILADAGSKLVIIDFFATWCGPCRNIAPQLEELAKEFKDSLIVVKVDVDELQELAEEYNIKSLPTFVFIKSGNVAEEFSGANYDKLRNTAIKHMK